MNKYLYTQLISNVVIIGELSSACTWWPIQGFNIRQDNRYYCRDELISIYGFSPGQILNKFVELLYFIEYYF